MISEKWYVIFMCISVYGFVIQTRAEAAPKYSYSDCENSTTSTSNSYRSNLNQLSHSLTSSASSTGFFYTPVGRQVQDMVFGLFMCRGDIVATHPMMCQQCVGKASEEIRRRCPVEREAIIWYDECMVRYSDRAIFNISDETAPVFLPEPNSTSPEEEKDSVKQMWSSMINTLTVEAAKSKEKFAEGEEAVEGSEKRLYGWVQCTPDLEGESCSTCFQKAIDFATPRCCRESQGGRVLLPSCFIRYEFFRFFYPLSSPPPLPLTTTPPPPPPQGTYPSLVNFSFFIFHFQSEMFPC